MTATESNKQRNTLIIGLSIPIFMMLFVAAAIHLPRWFTTVEPAAIDFVYSMGERDYSIHYLVRDHQLTREQQAIPENDPRTGGDLHFFVHEVATNSSREISFEQARQLSLEPTAIAPDGYRIEHGRRAGWFPFDSHTDYGKRFLVKEHFSQELNLQLQSIGGFPYSGYQFHGWVTGR